MRHASAPFDAGMLAVNLLAIPVHVVVINRGDVALGVSLMIVQAIVALGFGLSLLGVIE